MKKYKVNLLPEAYEDGYMPSVDAYVLDKSSENVKRATIVIAPGGGYGFVSENWEGERIAMNYLAYGFNAVVLDYTVCTHGRHPRPIKEIAAAIKLCRDNSDEWGVDRDKIAVCGFSAGGHLAASISTLWNSNLIFFEEEIDSKIYMPNATVLCYPVITSGEFAHKDSFINLLGTDDESNPLWELMSLEKQVNKETPPAFLWHTFEDNLVPLENSLLYASALRKSGIPFEMHIYPKGYHGLSLTTDDIARGKSVFKRDYDWMKLSVDWIYTIFGLI